jgi:dTDP-4-amino-4,6-dideoxygalactose transaminase
MNDVAASIGLGNLPYVQAHLRHRSALATAYRNGLSNLDGLTCLAPPPIGTTSSDWLFPVLVEERASFTRYLAHHGIETGPVHYRNDAVRLFRDTRRRELPVTERWARQMTCLPIGHWVTQNDLAFIVATIRKGW